MATGVKPRDEETQFSRSDLEAIQDAMKDKKFRELLSEYCEEVRDPANQALYQKEMTQLEKERGYDVTFINPNGGYVIKTSVAGDRKAFINICSNENIGRPSHSIAEVAGRRGMNWLIPYSLISPREDYDQNRKRCVVYDVVFHPDTLRMAEVNKQFRELVNNTAFDGLQKTYNINLDSNNFRLPKSKYKGMAVPAVIRQKDPNYKPQDNTESDDLPSELLEKLYPQKSYTEQSSKSDQQIKPETVESKKESRVTSQFTHQCDKGYTIPKYVIKQQKNLDLQDFTYHKDSKQYSAIPSHLLIEINLPLLSSTKDCTLDVKDRSLLLVCEKPAKYKLNITLPYSVNDECGTAKFDKSLHKLIITLPVVKKNVTDNNKNSLKVDSGVESEENSSSQSDEENNNNLIEELPSVPNNTAQQVSETKPKPKKDEFFEPSFGYVLPQYTHNALDDIIAMTFHVKNAEPDSVHIKNCENIIFVKFTSVGTGYVPVHYAAVIVFDENVKFENVTGEAWDNNVILQMEVDGELPQKFKIGLNESSLNEDYFEISQSKKSEKAPDKCEETADTVTDTIKPVVEVTSFGSETNILVSSNNSAEDEDEDDDDSAMSRDIVWVESCTETGAKSILRKPLSSVRSYSESSVGDVASSMDYISSDCIPEESSFKKTVRFNDVIARQFYRYNSSIEGQKKKNQRKKSKKRNQERRRSESEAEEDSGNSIQNSKYRVKSTLKQRRDSGLADTSDAEECKTSESYDNNSVFSFDEKKTLQYTKNDRDKNINAQEIGAKSKKEDSERTKNNMKHKTDLYDPDRLNKGKYQEVSFKNDLIFDLDM